MTTEESQRDEVQTTKVWKTKGESINISASKTDVPPTLGKMGEGNEYITPLKAIQTPELWNSHDGVTGVYPRTLKSLQYQRLKWKEGINR